MIDQTEILDAGPNGLERAAALLRDGQLVAFPTETVYGLGGNATDAHAAAKIFEAKGRPHFNPLIAHVSDADNAATLIDLSGQMGKLAEAFWPGPLTLVAQMRAPGVVADLVTAGLQTLAVRVPAHPLARSLLRAVGHPVAAPSANPSGRVSPTTAAHVLEGLSGRISAVVDGGACTVGLESTIVGAGQDGLTLLRPGGIPTEEIERVLGRSLGKAGGTITAPGQLASHYAPSASVRLNASAPRTDEEWLGFGAGPAGLNLSPKGDLHEAAANLFAYLRRLDAKATQIAVAPIPERGLGRAINDRLRRAAAPR